MGWVQERHADVAVAALVQTTRRQQEIIARQARVVRAARSYIEAAQDDFKAAPDLDEAEAFAYLEAALLDLDEACGR